MKGNAILAVLLFAAAGAIAQTNTATTAQYTGTVVDDQGRRVAGATVDCYHYPTRARFGYWDREPKLQQTTVTDGKGTFSVSASADTTLVVVKKSGLAPTWKTWSTDIPASTDPIVLTATAALSGMVVADSGQPVSGAEVWVVAASIGNGYDSESQLNDIFGGPAKSCFSARTGTDGRFRIENFPADGRAGLGVRKVGLALHTVGSELGGETDFQPGQDLKLVVGPAGNVEGKVMVAETGQPLGGVKIKIDQFGAGVFGSDYYETVESRADGTFRVPDVQPGKHCIRAYISGGSIPDWVFVPEESQIFTVTAGETTNVVVHFSKGALVEVKVVVTNTLQPLAKVAVSSGETTSVTDDNGISFVRTQTGTNWFSASKQDWSPQQTKAGIESGQTNHVRIEMIPPPRITGIVRDPNGAPAPGARVSFHPGRYPNAPLYSETNTDENGRYEMVILQESRGFGFWSGPINPISFVMAQDLKRNLATIQELGNTNSDFFSAKIEPISTNLDLVLQPGITITGLVKDTDGSPVTNATVDISMLSNRFISRLWPRPAKVDGQGVFTLPALPQGREYDFWQGIMAKGYGTAGGFLKPEDSKTNHYEFPAFVLKRADRQLAGQVLGRDGKPVVGARVNISGQGQLMLVREAKSDGQGHFIFDGVCAGEVRVNARYYPSPDMRNSEQGDVAAQGGDTNVVVRLGIYANNNGGNLSPLLKTAGTVRDARGKAVAGVKVSLFPVQGRSVETTTGADGHYEINWQTLLNQAETEWVLARDLKSGGAALRQADKTSTNLDLTLEDGMAISVKVSDTDGQLLTNATMSVSLRLGNRGFGVDSQPATADERGILRVAALLRGQRYNVNIGAPGHTSSRFQEIEADETKTKSLELPPVVLVPMDREVAGQVLGADGKPVAGTTVQVQGSGMIGQRTTTDSDGRFAFRGITRGQLSLSAGTPIAGSSALSNSGSARVESGDTNVVIRLGTDPSPLAAALSQARITTSGTVFDPSSKPVPGARVEVLPGGWAAVQSDTNGKYSIQWRDIFVRTHKTVMFAQDVAHNLAATAEMDAATTNLDIHLQPGLVLSGSVQNSRGRPVTNAVVQLIPFPPDDLTRSTLNRQQPTNAMVSGLYSFTALPQGTPYIVRVSADGYWPANVRVAAADTKVEKLELPKAVLELADRQISGQVLGLSGKPCWGAEVSIIEEDLPSKHVTHTDSSGHFVINRVPKVLLIVRASLPVSASNPRFLFCTNLVQGGDRNVVLNLRAR
jgi:protocatechuate 3,4-dioxygenase beta subunit